MPDVASGALARGALLHLAPRLSARQYSEHFVQSEPLLARCTLGSYSAAQLLLHFLRRTNAQARRDLRRKADGE